MSGFVATAPAESCTEIKSDWYPAIRVRDARDILRIDGTVPDARLTEILTLAMAAVEDQLEAWQQQQILLGRNSLTDVPSKQFNGESRLVLLYRRAIYASAQADLIEKYRDFDSTKSGERRAQALDPTVEDCRRNVRYAIRDILGRPRADVELI